MTEQPPKTPEARPRLDPDIRARVDTYARETRRSLNAAVNHLLDDALTRHETSHNQEQR